MKHGVTGIIGAMQEEIDAFLPQMEITLSHTIAGSLFTEGTLNGSKVVLVCSGIGKVNAAVCVQILANIFNVTSIVNTGVAGGLNPELDIFDIVISKDLVQHDFDATGFGYDHGEIPRMPSSMFSANEELLSLAKTACAGDTLNGQKVIVGRIASGDIFVTEQKDRDKIITLYKADCVEMEGAAIAHAAYLNEIPFIVIRAISDTASDSAMDDFAKFAQNAATRSAAIVCKILELT
ncbi:MAG: 5'-methylthioadenosine/adenosylhomocysteine nucleosidase [Defluviitaleaceae bacterium]|nr:5'-methylthioadenosine/adenosylhomocysteine nucleosidase [Defluviitaleaceae bacterium]